MKNINELLATINLCDDNELETLTSRCNRLLEERRAAARNTLRHELMENLQKAINDVLRNGFAVTVENSELSLDETAYTAVYLEPEDTYSIKIE